MAPDAVHPLENSHENVSDEDWVISFDDEDVREGMREEDFAQVPVWIQLWGLPVHCKTRSLGWKIGRALEKIKYERIGNFCHYCGHINHEIRSCGIHLEDSVKGNVQEESWGLWIRAEQFGWLVSSEKENLNPNRPSTAEKEADKFLADQAAKVVDNEDVTDSGRKRQNIKSLARKGSSFTAISGVKRGQDEPDNSISSKKYCQ
ncbi:hypothetical protein PIB30_089879 [Stylosanthes scabra]|uniref:DUF4283 domain-containing protein n=1 Tax=Stylosanthes scabra TaxID=79078 RepID=A0ABU6SVQ0_9FABA|nr:hypothetical protein [Stylosanthes scabra]